MHEERWHLGAQSDGQSRVADAFGSPAIGEADDEQAGVAGRFEDTCFARGDENGLGDDSDNLLHQSEARASSRLASRRPSAGFASVPRSRSVVPSDCASQAATSIAAQSCSTPPNGVTTGPAAISPAPDEHTDIAGCAFEDSREILVGKTALEELRCCVEKDEVDVVLCGESHDVGSRLARGESGDAGRDALLRQDVSAFGERSVRSRKLSRRPARVEPG